MAQHRHEDLDERLLHRLLFFTDAVFAIVLTLLVLELRPPEGATEQAQLESFRAMLPQLFAFALSFAIVAIFWVAHLSTTRRVARFDWPTGAANLFFLLPICLVPFASACLGAGLGTRLAWAIYAWVMIATSAANIVLVIISTRGGGRLLAEAMTPAERLYRVGRAATPGAAFSVGLLLLAADQVRFAQFCWTLIPLFLLVLRRLWSRPTG